MVVVILFVFELGIDVKQSVINFLLLIFIIEKIGKMLYYDFVKKYQIDYLGLKQIFFGEDLVKVKQEDVIFIGNVYQIFKKNKDYINFLEMIIGYVEKEGCFVVVLVVSLMVLKGFFDIWVLVENVSYWDIGLVGSVLIEKFENCDMVYKLIWLVNGKVVFVMVGWQFYNYNGLMDIKGNVLGYLVFLS